MVRDHRAPHSAVGRNQEQRVAYGSPAMGSVLRSRLDVRGEDYRSNLAAMQALWDSVAELLASVPSIGGQRYVDRHRARGKLLARERIEALVDHDTPLLELSPLAGWGSDFPIGAGSVNVIGVVEGVECAITASDMTYRGGSMNPRSVDKGERFREIILKKVGTVHIYSSLHRCSC